MGFYWNFLTNEHDPQTQDLDICYKLFKNPGHHYVFHYNTWNSEWICQDNIMPSRRSTRTTKSRTPINISYDPDVSYEAFEEDIITEDIDDEFVPGMMTTRTENQRRAKKRTISSTSTPRPQKKPKRNSNPTKAQRRQPSRKS